MMTTGAAHGAGIYTATDMGTSLGYMKVGGGGGRGGAGGEDGQRFLDTDSMCCMAICEIIDTGSSIKKSGGIWVVANDDHLTTRFLLVRSAFAAVAYCARFETSTTDQSGWLGRRHYAV